MSTPFGLDLVKLAGVTAPQPYMRPVTAGKFAVLRNQVAAGAGFDFLSRCGDVFRDAGFRSKKNGVANRSWHKTGRTFDYDQSSGALVIVSENIGGKQYWRTFLKCARQDGSQGTKLTRRDGRGGTVTAWMFDFTAAAEALGFHRIPSWRGFGWKGRAYNYLEFWHYQDDEGLTWDAAMAQLKGKKTAAASTDATPSVGTVEDRKTIVGLNDRGPAVTDIQQRLVVHKLLPSTEVDGIFGAKTKAAVQKFQKANGLAADGLVGPLTRAKLFA